MNDNKSKILGIDNFYSRDLYEDDLKTKEDLLFFLYDLDIYEYSLTKAGFSFLESYYGLDKVADYVLEDISKGVDFKYRTKEEIIKWLKKEGIDEPRRRKELDPQSD